MIFSRQGSYPPSNRLVAESQVAETYSFNIDETKANL
jgi:hypothetical protein